MTMIYSTLILTIRFLRERKGVLSAPAFSFVCGKMQPLAVAVAAAAIVTLWVLLPRAVRQGRRSPKGISFIHSVVLNHTQQHALEVVLLPLAGSDAEAGLAADAELSAAHVIGLDCEWLPDRGKNGHSPVSLLQLCSGNRCYLAQLLHMDGVPSPLRYLLENRLIVKASTVTGMRCPQQ